METTTNSLRRKTLLYAVIGLSLSLLSVILRCVNLFFFFDTDIGYHRRGAILPLASTILLIVAVIFFAVCSALWFRKTSVSYSKAPTVAVRIGAALAAAGVAALIVTEIIGAVRGGTLSVVNLLFGLLSIAYFVMLALNVGRDGLRILTGFCVILRLLLALGGSYFNIMIQMNAPDKLLFHLGCLGGMLFLVAELRALIGAVRPALYLFSAGVASLFLGVSSLPSILAYHSGRLTDASVIGGYYMLLGLFVYAVIRFLTVALDPTPADPIAEERPEPVADAEAPQEEEEEESEMPQEETPLAEEPTLEEQPPLKEESPLEDERNEDPS